MDNFHDPMTRHRDRNGGGVAIYVKNNIPVRRLRDLELDDVEWVWCLLKIQKTTLLLCSVYVPPNLSSSQYSLFLNRLTESISLAQIHSPDNIMILGDFNAGNTFLDPKFQNHSPLTPYEIALHDEIVAYNFEQLINQPTRYSDTSNTANLRDLIIVSNKSMVSNSGVFSPFSKIDHIPTFVSLLIEPPSISKQTIQIWDYGRTDVDKLTRLLMDIDWDNLLDCDLDKATENFTEALMTAAKASIPQKCFSTNSKNKPWFNAELKRQIRKRERLFKMAKRRDTPHDWERWRKQRNITTETNQRLKKSYIQSQVGKLLENKQNPRSYHCILKSLIGRNVNHLIPPLINQDGMPITDDLTKAKMLNNHFTAQTRLDT